VCGLQEIRHFRSSPWMLARGRNSRLKGRERVRRMLVMDWRFVWIGRQQRVNSF
jgi:hypothetical protein